MKLQTVVLLSAAALVSLSACQAGAPQPAAAPAAEAAPAGKVEGVRGGETALAVGQSLRISLPSNATTGYRWTLADTADGVLTPGAPFGQEITRPLEPGMVGVGGNTVWVFEAARPGTQTLTFAYGRPWETDAAPAETATYTITVR